MRLEELQRPIGEIFTDDTFKAFVYDFYQTLPDIDDIPAIGDIYRHILSDENIYRELEKYISYIEMQKQLINKDEEKKCILEETYFK